MNSRTLVVIASSCLVASAALPGSAGTLERVAAASSLKLGYVEGAAPYSYKDDAGKPAGYAIAVCEKLAAMLAADYFVSELKTEWVAVPVPERFAAVARGDVDLLCAGGAPTVSRLGEVSFSIPIFLSGIAGLVRDDASARMREVLEGRPEPYEPRWRASLGQVLRGRTFVAVKGSTAETLLVERKQELDVDARVETVDTLGAGVDRVASGTADVMFGDRALLLEAAKRHGRAAHLELLERHFSYEAAALAMQRGDDDFRLAVDLTLSKLYRSNEILAIYAAYFGKPDEQARRFFQMNALPE